MGRSRRLPRGLKRPVPTLDQAPAGAAAWYQDEYLESDDDPARIRELLAPSPEVEELLDRFLTLYT